MAKNLKSLQRTRSPGALFAPSSVIGLSNRLNGNSSSPVFLGALSETNIRSTSSFRYDNPGTGIKSTQELPLDWSQFENHTFFNSAEAKVNVAFDKIINSYPFDGTGKEVEAFEDNLTGYEKYVLEQWPKNTGYLLFSGTQPAETSLDKGTYIKVIDIAGALFPEFSSRIDGEAVLDPESKSFFFEATVFLPKQENENQIIFQKRESVDKSITLAVSKSMVADRCNLIFSVNSGSAHLLAQTFIGKGAFNHIAASFNRSVGVNRLEIYLSQSLAATSSVSYEMSNINSPRHPLIIGSGSSFSIPAGTIDGSSSPVFAPVQTFSGALDEIRMWHRPVISTEHLADFAFKDVFSQNKLAAYFKLNEPSGSYTVDNVVLDSSGNSLHSLISNYRYDLRSKNKLPETVKPPMKAEHLSNNPVLFPRYVPLSTLNAKLLTSASLYDDRNPNLITKLIPVHYLLEGQVFEGMASQDGTIGDGYTGLSMPGSGELGSAQFMTGFLLTWATFYDEIKMFIDHFSNVIHVDYDDNASACDKFLPFIAKYYGLELPNIYANADPLQYIDGSNISTDYSVAAHNLFFVQNQIWRRILINLKEIIKSKGTQHAIRSLFRAAGIDPDNIVNIREYGGPTVSSLSNKRIKRAEVSALLDFTGSLSRDDVARKNAQGVFSNFPSVSSPFLSASRVEIGVPQQAGAFVNKESYYPHGISRLGRDGLFTSGSFMFEGQYKFPVNRKYKTHQSLARLHVTGTLAISGFGDTRQGTVMNLTVVSGAQNTVTSSGSEIRLYARPDLRPTYTSDMNVGSKETVLILTGVNIFDGNIWNVAFGRTRNDLMESTVSSSLYLKVSRQSFGEIKEFYSTASLYAAPNYDVFQLGGARNDGTLAPFNTSGSFLMFGSQSLPGDSTSYRFLNNSNIDSAARSTTFEGMMGRLKFWSLSLSDTAWKEHVRYFKSTGVPDPLVNFNLVLLFSFLRSRCPGQTV